MALIRYAFNLSFVVIKIERHSEILIFGSLNFHAWLLFISTTDCTLSIPYLACGFVTFQVLSPFVGLPIPIHTRQTMGLGSLCLLSPAFICPKVTKVLPLLNFVSSLFGFSLVIRFCQCWGPCPVQWTK